MKARLEYMKTAEGRSKTAPQLATQFKCSERTIQRYRNLIRAGVTERKPKVRSVVQSANIARVKQLLTSKPNMSKRKVAKELKLQGIKISPTSVLSCAKMAGIRKFALQRKCRLRPQHVVKRLNYAHKHSSRQWLTALFVDEAAIELTSAPNHQNQGQWAVSREQVPILPKDKHPTKVSVFGGIAWSGRTKLVFIEKTLNGAGYADIMRIVIPEATRDIFKDRKWFIVQDAVPLHFTAEVLRVMSDAGVTVIPKSEWPPNSPDLNPIENIWAVLKSRVAERNPANKAQLIEIIKEEWANIPQRTIQNTIKSLTSRLETIVKNKGGYTNK